MLDQLRHRAADADAATFTPSLKFLELPGCQFGTDMRARRVARLERLNVTFDDRRDSHAASEGVGEAPAALLPPARSVESLANRGTSNSVVP